MNKILEQVQSGEFDPMKMFTGNKDKFLEVKTAIENISNNLTKETCTEFLLAKIIPTAFDRNVSDATRDEAVEIGFHLLKFVNVSILKTKDQEKILTSIEETYAKTVGELRDQNYANWDKLWIFLIRLCHDKIHGKLSLANKLLRVVEMAFRNSTSIDQRLKAYDCWKELIDNSSLNMQHMCSSKQIKLLVTPLRAKFSRTPIVINKRCDIFVYLLEKLQDKAFLCLREFLEFCFGPFEEKTDLEKMRQGKSVPEVCKKSTKILVEILGHSHKDTENCIQTNDIKLHKSIINSENFPILAEILLNSVVECCTLLNEWNSDSSQCNTTIKCLWRSLLRLIQTSNDETRKKCCTQLNNILRKLTERLEFNKQIPTILGNIFGLLIKSDLSENLKDVLFDVAMNLSQWHSSDYCLLNDVLNYINSCFESENGSKFSKIASTYFKTTTKCVNPQSLCEIWLKCGITINPANISSLIWPIRYFQVFRIKHAVNQKWTMLYNECKFESVKVNILQEMEKIFTENPLLSANVVHFLQLISTVENNSSKDFVARFLRLTELVLTLPNILESDQKKLSAITLNYCNQSHSFYKSDGVDEALDKLCGCLEHLITIHKDHSIFPSLYNYLKEGQPKILAKFSRRLMPILEALMLNDDDAVLIHPRKLMELLESKDSEPDSFPLASTRSLRIMNMANTPKPKSAKMKIFGKKDLSLKSNRSSPRSKNEVILNDDKSSDYVKIDTEVKLDVSKLSDHQKEIMRKRREDIPALYNDLTQSQSRDFLAESQETGEGSKENSQLILEPTPSDESKKRVMNEENDDRKGKKAKFDESLVRTPSERKEESLNVSDITQTLETTLTVPSEDKIEKSQFENVTKRSRRKQKFPSPLKENDKNKDKVNEESQNINEEKFEGNSVNSENSTAELKINENNKHEEKKLDESQKLTPNVRKSARQATRRYVFLNHMVSVSSVSDEQPVAEPAVRKSKRQFIRRLKQDKSPEKSENLSTSKTENLDHSKTENLDQSNTENLDKSNTDQQPPEEEDSVEALLTKVNKEMQENRKLVFGDSEPRQTSKGSPSKKKSNTEILDKANTEKPPEEKNSVDAFVTTEKIEEKRNFVFGNTEPRKYTRRSSSKNRNSDGNQNKIKPENSIADNLSKQETIRQLVSEVKEQVMGNSESSSRESDVYEFTGDEDYTIDELKRAAKKAYKRRNIPANMKGYIRRKKIKRKEEKSKSREEEVFHVTADSTPLSESQSLRAISSPHEGETITILITRSPIEVESKPESNGVIDRSPSRRRTKRKSPEVNSEDVIESSQQPDTDANSSGRNKYRSNLRRKTRSSSLEKKTETVDAPQVEEQKKVEEKNEEPVTKTLPRRRFSLMEEKKSAKRHTRTRSLDKFDADAEVTFLSQPTETPTLTSEKIPDTLTLKEDLPSSPITCDTPDRTTEFLNNTLDISPINSAHEEEDATPKIASTEVSNVRVARLLQMVNSNVQVSRRRWFGSKKQTSSPSTSRVRKMRLKQEENLDILTFSREVPSPLTVPASGILKRKFGDLEETTAPSPKRKRVNFSDPAISEKKIFIKDSEEYDLNDQTNDTTNQDLEKLLFDGVDREDTLDTIKELCDSNLKDLSQTKLKDALKTLISNLNVPEIVEVVTEFLANLDKNMLSEVSGAIANSESVKLALNNCVLPLMEDQNVFDLLLPKLIEVLERLPESKLERFFSEIVKVFGEHRLINVMKEEMAHKKVEEHNFDKIEESIKKHIAVLEDKKRNEFLVGLMNLASNELPVNNEFVNCHVDVLQKFVKRMN